MDLTDSFLRNVTGYELNLDNKLLEVPLEV